MHELVTDRGWYGTDSRRPQTPRNLATSLSIESAELLECFQWAEHADPQAVADELADVVLYAAQLATVMDIDLETALRHKMAHNRTRAWDLDETDQP
jgi:NTP pyrophosphatase (non-canonical NTP hydrolase)